MGFNDFVWTGTETDGTTAADGAVSASLGSDRPAHAEPEQQFGQMDNAQYERDNTVELPLYALSGVFEVAAVPGGSGERTRGVSGGFAPERAATGAARDGDSGPALGDGRAPGDANVDGIATHEAIPRGPGVVVGGRLPELDIVLPADADPTGLWSDGRTMWVVSDRGTGEVTTWSLADGRALGAGEVLLADGATRATHRFTLTGGGGDPAGLWSDGATLWVADALGGVRAYRLSDGRRTADGDIADEVLAAAGNHRPTGLWSDGVTLWVADNGAWKVFAYALPDRRRAADREFELADRAGAPLSPWGLWSDGATLLVSNHFDGGVLGFALADGAPRTDRAANAAPGGGRPLGLWSDGRTVWVVREGDRRIRAHAASGLRPRHPAEPADVFAVRVRTRAGAVPRGPAAGAPAAIADPALRDAVAAALDLEPHAAVRVRAMAALRSLDLRGAGVADLAGLEHAANLAALDLADNPVRDLSPLTALANLRVLGLGGVDADPWPLSALFGLRRLSLRGGGLTDVWALAGLVELEVLDLSGNPVADLRPLSGMRRLRALRLDGAADLSPLDGLDALVELDVDGLPRSPRACRAGARRAPATVADARRPAGGAVSAGAEALAPGSRGRRRAMLSHGPETFAIRVAGRQHGTVLRRRRLRLRGPRRTRARRALRGGAGRGDPGAGRQAVLRGGRQAGAARARSGLAGARTDDRQRDGPPGRGGVRGTGGLKAGPRAPSCTWTRRPPALQRRGLGELAGGLLRCAANERAAGAARMVDLPCVEDQGEHGGVLWNLPYAQVQTVAISEVATDERMTTDLGEEVEGSAGMEWPARGKLAVLQTCRLSLPFWENRLRFDGGWCGKG